MRVTVDEAQLQTLRPSQGNHSLSATDVGRAGTPSQRLIELQRTVGNRAVTQMVQRRIDTNGGAWATQSYKAVPDGAEITLEFVPNSNVDATKIGLIQKARKIEKGKNYDINARADYEHGRPQQDAQKRKAQRSDGDSHIDRDIKMNNPIYGAPNLNEGEKISKTPMGDLDMSEEAQRTGKANNYQLGYRKKKGGLRKSWKVRSAKLYDKPNLPGALDELKRTPTARSEMVFETTALAIDGKQEGTYYGSVSWGFQINDPAKGVELIPLARASPGDPTKAMQAVMANWNAGEFDVGLANPQIPLPKKSG